MGWLAWARLGPKPCPGGVFIEFQPPLTEPGPYVFKLSLDEALKPCEFEVSLPVPARVDTSRCTMAVELKTQSRGKHQSIVGLTFAAAPKRFGLAIKSGNETVYDAHIAPHYSPYPIRRDENRRFCGDQALVKPACVRESSQCLPFRASCSGPEGCEKPKACCANPDFGREFGSAAATECSSKNYCLERYGRIACHLDSDCPADSQCVDDPAGSDFKPTLRLCAPRPAAH